MQQSTPVQNIIIRLVVSSSSPCYDSEILFLDYKTTKVTKNKVSIHCLALCSGVMIDTLLKTGRYHSKAHAHQAILQAARTARLQVAHCLNKSSIPSKRKRCNNQLINQMMGEGDSCPSLP
jgi:hypothetical protein